MNIVILAAGLGKRMNSSKPKVLQPVAGKPMIEHVVQAALSLGDENKIVVVVGHGSDEVKAHLSKYSLDFALQEFQKGTGDALKAALPFIDAQKSTLVLYGDVPLIRAETLRDLIRVAGDGFSLLTIELPNPEGYGRIVRIDGKVKGIVEEKDATEQQKKIKEVNSGFMVLPPKVLPQWLDKIGCSNAQNEYYLTDLVPMAVQAGVDISVLKIQNATEVEGANNHIQLNRLERALQLKIATDLQEKGVRLADPNRIDVRGELKCGRDVFIDVGCVFEGNVSIEDGCQIGPYCVIKNSLIHGNVSIQAFTVIEEATIGSDSRIGPFARLRPLTELSNEVHIGNFVEIKKSKVGDKSKINHLSYIGDSTVGKDVNIGAGTITCNYDGANKFQTIIEDQCFIGSDTQLVAPVKVGEGATVGAGTTVTKDVKANSLVISRVAQKEIFGWKRPTKK